MVVYADVLIAVNFYINYFLIRGTSVLLRRKITSKRCIFAAAVGALMSLVIFLPSLPFWLSTLIKAASSIVLVWVAFGTARAPEMIINILCFLIISFVYAGLMLALWILCAPFGMFYRNGAVYFDIPIVAVALFTVFAYAIVRFVHYIMTKRSLTMTVREITIFSGEHRIKLEGIADTGNSLCDPFSGKPAIICHIDHISHIIPPAVISYLNGDFTAVEGVRLAPCSTIMGELLIPVFKADKIIIGDRPVDAVIGVCVKPIGTQCLFNPKLISL